MKLEKRIHSRSLVAAAIAAASLLLAPYAPVYAGTSFAVNNVLQVAAGGSPSQNCTSLRDVLSSIDDNGVLNRYLVRLEPGHYDCGDIPVVVGTFITLEGSGRNNTIIFGTVDDNFVGVVRLGGWYSGLRSLKVVNGKDPPDQAALALSIGTIRSDDVLGGILLEEIELESFKGLSLYSNARYEAWNSIFKDPLHHAESGAGELRYSQLWAVQGSGTFLCHLCTNPLATPLDTSCKP